MEGSDLLAALADDGRATEFVRDQLRQCKTILMVGAGSNLLTQAGLPEDYEDPSLLCVSADDGDAVTRFIEALGKHRYPECDPTRPSPQPHALIARRALAQRIPIPKADQAHHSVSASIVIQCRWLALF